MSSISEKVHIVAVPLTASYLDTLKKLTNKETMVGTITVALDEYTELKGVKP